MKFLKKLFIVFTIAIAFIAIPQVWAAEGDILLFDDFNDGNFNGWSVESGN